MPPPLPYTHSPPKDIQEVISNLPNDKILGLSNILSTENSKNQGELLIKIEKLHNKYYKDQEERLKKIEKQKYFS